MVRIGCDHLVYALMTTEDTPEAAPVYGEPKSAPGVMSLNINPNGSVDTLFADDGPFDSASTLGKIEVEIQKAYLTTAEKADLLGHAIDSKGALVYGGSDTPPYVAIGFRSLKSNGHYRYVWLYKGRFIDPEDNNETKGDSINFQSDTINGNFVKLSHKIKIGTKEVQPWKYEADEDADKIDATMLSGWFTAVVMPTPAA